MAVAAWLLIICILPPSLVISTILLLNYLTRHRLSLATQHLRELSASDVCIALAPLERHVSPKKVSPPRPVNTQTFATSSQQLGTTRESETTFGHSTRNEGSMTLDAISTDVVEQEARNKDTALTTSQASILSLIPTTHNRSIKGSKARTRPINSTSCYSPFDEIVESHGEFQRPARSDASSYLSDGSASSRKNLLCDQLNPSEFRSEQEWSINTSDALPTSPARALTFPYGQSLVMSNSLSTICEDLSTPDHLNAMAPEGLQYLGPAYHRESNGSRVWRDSSLRGPYHYDYV